MNDNPYTFVGVPTLSPIHIKRRSVSASAKSHRSPDTARPSSASPERYRIKPPYLVLKRGKKHHAFSAEYAPYPLNYEIHVVDYDTLDASSTISPSLLPQFTGDPSTHPRKCLDLGTGNGSFCLKASIAWPKTRFAGVDLVAIQPDVRTIEKLSGILQNSNSSKENAHKPKFDTKLLESARRIKWVHHNFLSKRLPFKDAEFDYIHVRGIAAGVPEDKWDFILSEIVRVLTPGGSLEMIEDDIIFPMVPLDLDSSVGGGSKLFYSEHARPSSYYPTKHIPPTQSGPSPSSGMGQSFAGGVAGSVGLAGAFVSTSPITSRQTLEELFDEGTPMDQSAYQNQMNINSGFHYMQYANTVPELVRPFPTNPFHIRPPASSEDHIVLEKLYMAVFSRRFINTRPTAIIGGMLGMHFNGVVASEALEIEMPIGNRHILRRRRGSAGSNTLYDLNDSDNEDDAEQIDDGADSSRAAVKDVERGPKSTKHGLGQLLPQEGSIQVASGPLSPPPTPKPNEFRLIPKTRHRSKRREVKDEDFRRHPTLALSSSLRTIFPNCSSESTRSIHLQRAWENVAACKEAMWEEFLFDSAAREAELRSKSDPSKPIYTGAGTLLDELEWEDSDLKRSERERFDILLDRRVRRHCGVAYETSRIPGVTARDRKLWWKGVEEDNSEDEVTLADQELRAEVSEELEQAVRKSSDPKIRSGSTPKTKSHNLPRKSTTSDSDSDLGPQPCRVIRAFVASKN